MVQIIPAKPSALAGLGLGLGQGLSQGFDQLLQTRQENKKAAELQNALSSLTPEQQKDPFAVLSALAKHPEQAKLLIGNLTSQKKLQGSANAFYSDQEFDQALDILGIPQDQRDAYKLLYKNASVGGRTAITKSILSDIDRLQAGGVPTQETKPIPSNLDEKEISQPQVKTTEEKEFEYPELDTFKGLTRTQKQSRENQLRKENAPHYQNAVDRVKKGKLEEFAIKKLNKLNDSKKLPKNVEKLLNVDLSTGELRFAGAANPETQEFVKIINDFTTRAKDSYGARVTNFELDRFLQRLPSLLNSEEGRRYILEYMNSINKLNQLYDQTLKDVYNHYKISNLTSQDAEQIAEQIIGDKADQLLTDALDADVRAQTIFDVKQKAPENNETLLYEGQYIYVPKNQVEKAIKAGAILL